MNICFFSIKRHQWLVATFLFFPFIFINANSDISLDTTTLQEKRQEQITLLSDAYGYVRYFYPNPHLKDFDWYKFLIYTLNETKDIHSDDEFIRKINSLFSIICPQMFFSTNEPTATETDGSKVKPFFFIENKNGYDGINSEIKRVDFFSEKYPIPDSLYSFHSGKYFISFPIALSSLPTNTKELKELKSKSGKIKLKLFSKSLLVAIAFKSKREIDFLKPYNVRIANEILRSNIIKHFYPYYLEDKISESWEKTCNIHWSKIASCKNLEEYYNYVCEFMHIVKDSHVDMFFSASVGNYGTYSNSYYPEIATTIYDNNIYIKEAKNNDLKAGSLILKINEETSGSLIERKLKSSSYSNLSTGLKQINLTTLFKSFRSDSTILLTIQKEYTIQDTVRIKIDRQGPYVVDSGTFIQIFDDSIGYVNLCHESGSYSLFKEKIYDLKKCKAIIFDLRERANPYYANSILAHTLDSIVTLGNLCQPVIYFPNHIKNECFPVEKWSISPATSVESEQYAKLYEYNLPVKEKFNVPFVFLTSNMSISYSETLLDMIKYYKVGTLIGENTAGCNGDMMYIHLPFAPFSITGYKFQNRDNSQHHGTGIIPDIYVENELDSDLQLITAIKFINENLETNN